METKCIDPAQEPLNVEQPCVGTLVGLQARRYETDIRTKLPQVLVSVGPSLVRMAQPLTDLSKEHAIRHPIVPRRRDSPGAWQQHHVLVDSLRELGRDTRPAATLRKA